jgi:hypothetical protein
MAGSRIVGKKFTQALLRQGRSISQFASSHGRYLQMRSGQSGVAPGRAAPFVVWYKAFCIRLLASYQAGQWLSVHSAMEA